MDRQRQEVAYFTDSFLPPSEVFMVEQARHLTRYTPKFLAMRSYESKAATKYPMQVERIGGSVRGKLAAFGLKLFGSVDPLFRAVTKTSALLHAQFGKNGYVVWPIAKKLNLPFVTTFHGYDATFAGNPLSVQGFNQRMFFWRGRGQMAKAGVNCIAVSNYIRTRLIELGFAERHIFRHYIGIDTALFHPQPQVERVKNRVVCVSRFVDVKGHRFIVEALAKLTQSGIPIELIMVGQGPLRDGIEREARLKLAKVTVLDDQSQDEVAALLCTAQLYIHGSYRTPTGQAEALGLSILEAQAVGTPVVAFDSGGVGEAIISGKTGYLVPEKDVNAMCRMAGAVLSDSDQWRSFSDAGIAHVRANFDITNCTRLLEDIYDRIIRDHSALSSRNVQ